jgi:hypothetical protein
MWPTILIILAGVGLIGSIGLLSEGNWGSGITGLLIWGAVLPASVYWHRSKRDEITYLIILTSASGESQASASPHEDWINKVLTALNNAIIARG